MATEHPPCRILVVEDEPIIALQIGEILQELGCIVIGPAGRLSVALRLATEAALDAAILDLDLRGQRVDPVAEQLAARRIPFVISSGHDAAALPGLFRDQPRLLKPFRREELVEAVAAVCGRRP